MREALRYKQIPKHLLKQKMNERKTCLKRQRIVFIQKFVHKKKMSQRFEKCHDHDKVVLSIDEGKAQAVKTEA